MGTATSVQACSKHYPWLGAINCTQGSVPYGQLGSNPSITGIGTDISFVLTAGLSLLTCGLVQLFCDRLGYRDLRKLLEPLVVSFGDQQILRGLSLSIATLYTSSACTIDAYRYNVLCYLLLMTIVSHLSSVLVLRSYVDGQVFLSCVRFVLVFAQIFFIGIIFSSRITDAFPTGIPSAQEALNTTLVLPAACFEHVSSEPYTGLEEIPLPHTKDSAALAMYVVLFIFYGINFLITVAHVFTYFFASKKTWQLRDEDRNAKTGSWFWWLTVFRGLILLSAWMIWIWAVVKMYQMKLWMMGSGWITGINLQNDNQWTFGQILSVLLLSAAPITFLNAWTDYTQARRERKIKQQKDRNSLRASTEPSYRSNTELLRTPSPSQSRYSAVPQTTFGERDLAEPYASPPSYEQVDTEMNAYMSPRRNIS